MEKSLLPEGHFPEFPHTFPWTSLAEHHEAQEGQEAENSPFVASFASPNKIGVLLEEKGDGCWVGTSNLSQHLLS